MLDVTAFKITVDLEITDKIVDQSISPLNVGGRIKALADLIATYVNTSVPGKVQRTYTENDFDGDGLIHTDSNPPGANKQLVSVNVNDTPLSGVLYDEQTQTLSGLGGYFSPGSQPALSIVTIFI